MESGTVGPNSPLTVRLFENRFVYGTLKELIRLVSSFAKPNDDLHPDLICQCFPANHAELRFSGPQRAPLNPLLSVHNCSVGAEWPLDDDMLLILTSALFGT